MSHNDTSTSTAAIANTHSIGVGSDSINLPVSSGTSTYPCDDYAYRSVSSEGRRRHIGTATDGAPTTLNAATQSTTLFDYRRWFPAELHEEAGSTESGDGRSSSEGGSNSGEVDYRTWGRVSPARGDGAREGDSDQDFVLQDGPEGDEGGDDESEGFSLATSSREEEDMGAPTSQKRKEPHGPLPVASALDSPQLQSSSVNPSTMPLETDQPTDSNGMLWRPLQSEPQVSLRHLGDEILAFVDSNLTLSPEEVSDRERFINRLRTILKETIGPKCDLKVHGSFITNLALRESDIDFLVTDYGPMQPIAAIDKMTLALLQFTNDDTPVKTVSSNDVSVLNRTSGPSPGTYVPRHEGEVFTVQAIVFTRVPIIKITEKKTGIKGDLSFGGGHHDESMLLTRRLLTRFPTARPLLLFLKNILKDGQMGESAKGGLSSFALYLLVMHFYNIRFHCDGRMWEPTRTPADAAEAEVGSSYSTVATPSSLAEGAGPSPKFGGSSSVAAGSPNGPTSAAAALGGTRLEKVSGRIEEFLSGPAPIASTTKSSADATSSKGSPAPQTGDDDANIQFEEENDPRTLGEVFCLFCWYYSEFEIQSKGIVFDEDGNSFVVPKPDALRGKATLHMTSPFDSSYDITARVTCIQAFQQLLFLVTVIITAGAKEQTLSLTNLHEQIRECFVDEHEPFDDTAYRIYAKSTMLLSGPFPQRGGRTQATRHHGHKGHGSMAGHHHNQNANSNMGGANGAQHHYTYFHSQGSYNMGGHYQTMQGYHHPQGMAAGQQIQAVSTPTAQGAVAAAQPSAALPGLPSTHNNHYYRDPNSGQPSVGGEKRNSEGRHGTPTSRGPQHHHARAESVPNAHAHTSHVVSHESTKDATTSTSNQAIPRTATVTTQTTGVPAGTNVPHHQHPYMPNTLEQGMYNPTGFFPPYASFAPQNSIGYPTMPHYYGGYPYGPNGPYMGNQQLGAQGGAQQNGGVVMTGAPGGSPASMPVAPTSSFPKMKRGVGKGGAYEHGAAFDAPASTTSTGSSMITFPTAGGRGRGGGKMGASSRQSPPINPAHPHPHSHGMQGGPMLHGFFPTAAMKEHVMIPLPAPQHLLVAHGATSVTLPNPAMVGVQHGVVQVPQGPAAPAGTTSTTTPQPHAKASKASKKAAAAAAAAVESADVGNSCHTHVPEAPVAPPTPPPAPVARYVPPCRKPKPKAGDAL